MELKYRRILLKLSGEILREGEDSLCPQKLSEICDEIVALKELGTQVALVVGGGNIFRGLKGMEKGIERTTGDYMGMMATMINAMAIADFLRQKGQAVALQSSLPIEGVLPPIERKKNKALLESRTILVFAGGTGLPFFSTDSNAALRAAEIEADAILKATKVDGVYDKDPEVHSDAKRYDTLSYETALDQNLKVMDSTAFSLCRDNKIPILVFKLQPDSFKQALLLQTGTLVS